MSLRRQRLRVGLLARLAVARRTAADVTSPREAFSNAPAKASADGCRTEGSASIARTSTV